VTSGGQYFNDFPEITDQISCIYWLIQDVYRPTLISMKCRAYSLQYCIILLSLRRSPNCDGDLSLQTAILSWL